MEALIIEKTKATPWVKLYPYGELFIEGRSLPEDPERFYVPVLEWIRNYKGSKLTIDIKLEYMNSSSSKQMFVLLLCIENNAHLREALINWHYDVDDEDTLEAGQEFESLIKLPFKFLEYATN